MPIAGRVLVSVGDNEIADVGLGVAGSAVALDGSGVHVGGNPIGVAVEICRAGPSGSCHFPCHNQMTSPIKKQASTERKERVAFWKIVIDSSGRAERSIAETKRAVAI